MNQYNTNSFGIFTAIPLRQVGKLHSTSATNLFQPQSPEHMDDIPIRFQLCGPNAFVNDMGTSAAQINSSALRSYVFTNRPMKVGEKITISIHKLHRNTFDTLGFGLTSCNPLDVKIDELPDDSDELVERSEYWACVKNVSVSTRLADKLEFTVGESGAVIVNKNGLYNRTIMHVDKSIPLWAFFDLNGPTFRIELIDVPEPETSVNLLYPVFDNLDHVLLDSIQEEVSSVERGVNEVDRVASELQSFVNEEPNNDSDRTSTSIALESLFSASNRSVKVDFTSDNVTEATEIALQSTSSQTTVTLAEERSRTPLTIECVVCSGRADNLILPCRHLCLCSECVDQLQQHSRKCPVCRGDIESILRIYY
ncbi:hypothetical protein M3Y94_00727000 [Aphelenchoides besseyi]|nr:hypothetical protein M3Y94_00727000 [Aphelenchoides besseyi]KAI6231849.1 Protein neuralized-like isoform X3 [Aphelenchoides besseyi]